MLEGKRIVVVLPAYNAARTLRQTVAEISRDLVDEILLVDDASQDETVTLAKELGLQALVHASNKGYGASQKTCYREALALGAGSSLEGTSRLYFPNRRVGQRRSKLGSNSSNSNRTSRSIGSISR
jgi:glycosyltransferase involved in cell wall biosynthesis